MGASTPITVVLLNGGAVAMSAVKQQADAIVEAWYPGFFGARAIARALFGQSNRWGKLPVTIYDEGFVEQFDMLDFSMTKAPGRTYRYFTGTPLWEFGFGLSYTSFSITALTRQLVVSQHGSEKSTLKINVHNIGSVAGDEVVMAFFTALPGTLSAGSRAALLRKQLFDFKRVSLAAGQSVDVEFLFDAKSFTVADDEGNLVSYAGEYMISISNGLADLQVNVRVDGHGNSRPLMYEPWVPPGSVSPETHLDQVFV